MGVLPSPDEETLLLSFPSASATKLAFVHGATDIWLCDMVSGVPTAPRRIVAGNGTLANLRISPDEQYVAFSGNECGQWAVYVQHISGGMPQRLTYHPGNGMQSHNRGAEPRDSVVCGWTPDSTHVLFTSTRLSPLARGMGQLYKVPIDPTVTPEGALPVALPLPEVFHGVLSPNADAIAYVELPPPTATWKRYRGGQTQPVMMFDLTSMETTTVPFENDNCSCPCWGSDGSVYFISDRSGSCNIWSYSPASGELTQMTHHSEQDTKYLSYTLGASVLVYAQAGRLHVLPLGGTATPLSLKLPSDFRHSRTGYRTGPVMSASLSPSGVRAAVAMRGEVLTLPVEHGAVRNISNSPGINERAPAWSPDGQWIATIAFNGADEDTTLIIRPQIAAVPTVADVKIITLGPNYYYTVVWSPDSTKLALVDKTMSIFLLDLEKENEVTEVASFANDPSMGTRTEPPRWSPDSQWLAYLQEGQDGSACSRVMLYSVVDGTTSPATDGRADVTSVCAFIVPSIHTPIRHTLACSCWSTDGKCLFHTASAYSFGPEHYGLDMSTLERPVLRSIYVTVLANDQRLPFPPLSDDEAPNTDDASRQEEVDKDTAKEREASVSVRIDLEGLCERTAVVPLGREGYFAQLAANQGKLFFAEMEPMDPVAELGLDTIQGFDLHYFDLNKREENVYAADVRQYELSASGSHVLLIKGNGKVIVTPAGSAPGMEEQTKGTLPTDNLKVAVEPHAEWAQILAETYKLYRDLFYASNLHGVDWPAQYAKYKTYIPHCAHRVDVTGLQCDLVAEICAGHCYVQGGDLGDSSDPPPQVGLLGCSYSVEQDSYRIAKIFRPPNWHAELSSPLAEPGVGVSEGDFLLAVNGVPLMSTINIYKAFEMTAQKLVTITISDSPKLGASAAQRDVDVVTLSGATEQKIRQWSWVEERAKIVDELSDGRLGYIYMPNTGPDGYTSFNRDKQGLVIDERTNGGGCVADYVLDMLSRYPYGYFNRRDHKAYPTPRASIFGPKAMIINAFSGSGGDWMPYHFRQRGLGKLIGKRTWGGLVGISGVPPLVDGGTITVPSFGAFSTGAMSGAEWETHNRQGDDALEWENEQIGTFPDVEVAQDAALVISGADPQLEAAVAVVLEQLEQNPPPPPHAQQPPLPVRSKL